MGKPASALSRVTIHNQSSLLRDGIANIYLLANIITGEYVTNFQGCEGRLCARPQGQRFQFPRPRTWQKKRASTVSSNTAKTVFNPELS